MPRQTFFGVLLRYLFDIELNYKYEIGYFHTKGYSGKQKDNKYDIIIIEQFDGQFVTIPNDRRYYTFEVPHHKKTELPIPTMKWSDDDMIKAAKYGYDYRATTSFPEQPFEKQCINNTRQWLIHQESKK